jgi:hypothetical protein
LCIMNQLTVEMSLSCQDSLRQVFLISSGHGGHTYEHPYDHIDLPSPRIRTVSGLRSARWWRQAGVSVTIERSWEPNPFNGDGGIKTSGRWRPAWPGGAPVMWTWRAGAWARGRRFRRLPRSVRVPRPGPSTPAPTPAQTSARIAAESGNQRHEPWSPLPIRAVPSWTTDVTDHGDSPDQQRGGWAG